MKESEEMAVLLDERSEILAPADENVLRSQPNLSTQEDTDWTQ
jgi:hypothetical protein